MSKKIQEILQPEIGVDVLEEEQTENQLIVHNDEVNTFDWVIQSLIEICNHSLAQAEQCSIIIHNKGRASVKHGGFDTLKIMKDGLTERGIQATIE